MVFFENAWCGACGATLAYSIVADAFVMATGDLCVRAGTIEACNWQISPPGPCCASCLLDLEHRIDELCVPFQAAKRRVLRQLWVLGLDVTNTPPLLRFEFRRGSVDDPVTIGHADGVITLDVAEGDPSRITAVRTSLGEPYRTPLGHVRHELGHWFWQAYVAPSAKVEEFRRCFGDERASYPEALEAHYARPDDGSWRSGFISHYASAHPWEDFAESFAHYLHLADTLETARAHGLWPATSDGIPFTTVYADWVRLTMVLNELNRSMGTEDAYPFVAAPPAVDKIAFVRSAIMELADR